MKFKVYMYFISLSLLWPLLIVKDFKWFWDECNSFIANISTLIQMNLVSDISIILLVIGFLFSYLFLRRLKGATKNPKTIVSIENKNFEYISFLMTYIVAFARINRDDYRGWIVTFLVLILIGLIFVRTSLFYSNPIFAIVGLKLYKVSTEQMDDLIFISWDKLDVKDSVGHIKLDEKIYFVRK